MKYECGWCSAKLKQDPDKYVMYGNMCRACSYDIGQVPRMPMTPCKPEFPQEPEHIEIEAVENRYNRSITRYRKNVENYERLYQKFLDFSRKHREGSQNCTQKIFHRVLINTMDKNDK